ncbi:hypothetical protein CAEBREN_22246 [Caenorhabditis brenneri]|uniref:Uncharacterized protein n=1 Tax=Caenorhabditis brenneri TaxID=135651 RepID=G0MV10_CAEBE|nr:hypothetical protein CAEBREN_22246 [Caenorhabditis brenneri]
MAIVTLAMRPDDVCFSGRLRDLTLHLRNLFINQDTPQKVPQRPADVLSTTIKASPSKDPMEKDSDENTHEDEVNGIMEGLLVTGQPDFDDECDNAAYFEFLSSGALLEGPTKSNGGEMRSSPSLETMPPVQTASGSPGGEDDQEEEEDIDEDEEEPDEVLDMAGFSPPNEQPGGVGVDLEVEQPPLPLDADDEDEVPRVGAVPAEQIPDFDYYYRNEAPQQQERAASGSPESPEEDEDEEEDEEDDEEEDEEEDEEDSPESLGDSLNSGSPESNPYTDSTPESSEEGSQNSSDGSPVVPEDDDPRAESEDREEPHGQGEAEEEEVVEVVPDAAPQPDDASPLKRRREDDDEGGSAAKRPHTLLITLFEAILSFSSYSNIKIHIFDILFVVYKCFFFFLFTRRCSLKNIFEVQNPVELQPDLTSKFTPFCHGLFLFFLSPKKLGVFKSEFRLSKCYSCCALFHSASFSQRKLVSKSFCSKKTTVIFKGAWLVSAWVSPRQPQEQAPSSGDSEGSSSPTQPPRGIPGQSSSSDEIPDLEDDPPVRGPIVAEDAVAPVVRPDFGPPQQQADREGDVPRGYPGEPQPQFIFHNEEPNREEESSSDSSGGSSDSSDRYFDDEERPDIPLPEYYVDPDDEQEEEEEPEEEQNPPRNSGTSDSSPDSGSSGSRSSGGPSSRDSEESNNAPVDREDSPMPGAPLGEEEDEEEAAEMGQNQYSSPDDEESEDANPLKRPHGDGGGDDESGDSKRPHMA